MALFFTFTQHGSSGQGVDTHADEDYSRCRIDLYCGKGRAMKRRSTMLTLAAAGLLTFVPGPATADPNNASGTWQLHIEVPNVARASNRDTLAITGTGVFSIHPKAVTASGTFTHTVAGNGSFTGTWTATDLLSFEFYGCGVVSSIGATLPPNFCGGALKMRVAFAPAGTSQSVPGIINIFCVIGSQAPPPHDNPTEPGEEGMTAVVPGVANFNKIVSGMNLYIRTS
jgi:hypothetical protein